MQKCFAVDILDKSLNKIEKNIDDAASKKAVVKDIYKSSLNQFYYEQLQILSDTVSKVKTLVNERYYCSLKDKDIINILYYANVQFKRDIDTMTISSISKPSVADMKSSCSKFNICIWQSNGQVGEVASEWCIPKMSNFYADISSNEKSVSTLVNRIKGSEYFWNGTLDDSTYDLLVDVYDVAKILFGNESAVEPPQTVFFDMPKLDNADGVYNGDESSTVVDRFSPYNTTTSAQSANNNLGGNGSLGGKSNVVQSSGLGLNDEVENNNKSGQSIGINTGNTFQTQKDVVVNNNLNEGLDNDIYNFIETVNTLSVESQNVTTVSLGNQCVSGFSYQYKTGYTITDTGVILSPELVEEDEEILQQPVEEYLSDVLQQIHKLQCNNDFICDSWESTTCPDCMPMQSGSAVISEVEDLINSLDLGSGDEVSQQTLSCVANCKATQVKVESLLLCVAKCFCTTYESKQFDPTVFPGLSPVFKMKFCVIPATQVEKSNNKIVRSIQSVFDVMYDLLSNLKYGGGTMPAVKTKTYLDSSYMKDSFGKTISFLITSKSKRHTSQVSKKTKDKTQEKVNTELSENIIGFGQDIISVDEKNKYIVAQTSYTGKTDEILKLGNQIHESLQNDIVISVDSRFHEFMQLNAGFWKEIKNILQEFNTQSEILYDKRK